MNAESSRQCDREHDETFDVLTRHLEEEVPKPSSLRADVPPWLDSITLRMLAKRPDERFVTVYRLVEALRTRVPTTYCELTMFEHTEVAATTRIGTIVREFVRLASAARVLLRYAD